MDKRSKERAQALAGFLICMAFVLAAVLIVTNPNPRQAAMAVGGFGVWGAFIFGAVWLMLKLEAPKPQASVSEMEVRQQ